ncbi:MAG TPA: DUF6152 family protein [Micropepsaceae bacterium]|nr:DUF6152 family protein [Micropepsaceae bacterium]
MTLSKYLVPGAAFAIAAAIVAPASAHHSYAMFATDKNIAVEGTVKQFMWTNPHSWIRLEVMDPQGKQQEWNVEMGSLTILVNLGWTPKTLLPGDKIKMTLHPMKSGLPGGDFVSLDSGGHGNYKNDGGSQNRQKERAAHRATASS